MKQTLTIKVAKLKAGDVVYKEFKHNKLCILSKNAEITEELISKLEKYNSCDITVLRKKLFSDAEIKKMKNELIIRMQEQFKYYEGDVNKETLMKIFLRHFLLRVKA